MDKDEIIKISDTPYVVSKNQQLLIDKYESGKETKNRVEYDVINLEEEDISDDNYLYPHTSDPNFSLKISKKKEFMNTHYPYYESADITEFKKKSNMLMGGKMIFSPHQIFVRNFLSSSTPYNSLLLFHGLGSGKTLSSIGVSEQYRKDMRNVERFKTILVVASPNVQRNFRLQLFDERRLSYESGFWNYDGNNTNSFLKELNPMGLKGLYNQNDRTKVIKNIMSIINKSYTFMGYRKFANYIENIEQKSKVKDKIKKTLFKKQLEHEFNDRLVIIDEIHNIKKIDSIMSSGKRISRSMINVIKNSDNMRLLLLSATPMYNDYKEIIWILNMMNLNDGRDELYIKDVFNKSGEFNTGRISGRDILIKKARGYISFVRGENPYTFPYRIFPNLHSPKNSILNIKYPTKQLNGQELFDRIDFVDVYPVEMSAYQKSGYQIVKDKNLSKIQDIVKSEIHEDAKYNYSKLQHLIECLNYVFPNPNESDEEMRDVIYGVNGINTLMDYEKSIEQRFRKNFKYKPEVLKKFGRVFSYKNIGKYSGKAKDIMTNVMKSKGVSIIYSNYVDGGVLPMALCLEEMGFKRYGKTDSLFEPKYISDKKNQIVPIDHNFKERSPVSGKSLSEFKQASYIVISGDNTLSPNNTEELVAATNDSNYDGSNVKVIFITRAGSESLDFKFVRNVFIMDPWYNLSRIEQIIGRAIRFKSHKNIDFEERNTSVYLYCTLPGEDDCETADMYIYRKAEKKAKQIGNVTRVLKEASIDCVLNHNQTKYTQENMDLVIKQTLSNGSIVDYSLGDKPFSPNCDYMDTCVYKCQNHDKLKITESADTFDEKFSEINMEIIIDIVKDLFSKRYIYVKDDLIDDIKNVRLFSNEEIDIALEKISDNEMFVARDSLDRQGYIVNVGNYYMYQPSELKDRGSTVFERITPIDNKLPHVKINIDGVSEKAEKTIEENYHIYFHNMYHNIETYSNKTPNDIDNRTNIMHEYMGYNVIKAHVDEYDKNVADACLIEYLFDRTNIDEKTAIINFIWPIYKASLENDGSLNSFQEKLIHYMKTFCFDIENGGKNEPYFIFENNGTYSVFVINDESKWVIDDSLKTFTLDVLKKRKEISVEDFSQKFKKQYIGLMMFTGSKKTSKDSKIEFKMKLMENKKSRSFSGLDHLKTLKIDMINNYLYGGKKIIPEKIGKQEDFYNFCDKDSKFRVKSLTVLMELTYRYYDKVRHDNKRWFLDPVEAVVSKMEGTILI